MRSYPHTGHIYDVAIVGAGLAGCELAYRLAQANQDVLLVSQSLDSVGNLFHAQVPESFPADSLAEAARLAILPGQSVWDLHCAIKFKLEMQEGIHLLQSCVTALEAGHTEQPHRLQTWEGIPRLAKRVVLAVGSFMQAQLYIGEVAEEAGRLSEIAYGFLQQDLAQQGVQFVRRQDTAPSETGGLPYSVSYLTLSPDSLNGFGLQGWQGVYALGRCRSGEYSYSSTILEAHQLADLWSQPT